MDESIVGKGKHYSHTHTQKKMSLVIYNLPKCWKKQNEGGKKVYSLIPELNFQLTVCELAI